MNDLVSELLAWLLLNPKKGWALAIASILLFFSLMIGVLFMEGVFSDPHAALNGNTAQVERK